MARVRGSLEPLTQIGSAALEVGKLGQGGVLLTEALQLIPQGADLLAARFGLTTQGIHLGDELADLGQPLNGGADPQLDIGIVAGHQVPLIIKKPGSWPGSEVSVYQLRISIRYGSDLPG